MSVARTGEAIMKVTISGVFAASLTLMTGAANAASIVDTVIASARSQWYQHNCQLGQNGISCQKHRTSAKAPYETASAKSTVVNESYNAAPPSSPVGQWIVEDGDRRVQIMRCGKSLCGVISAAKPDSLDSANPDPDQRHRTIVNLPVLIEMRQIDNNRWEGNIYNTKDGRTYFGNISLRGTNLLEVEGNAPHALLMQTWIKDTD
jgi:uncharacterized protein (DUF2147 family)